MFQTATFLGAFLLFQVQPLVAKRILPWFGGGPSVWSAALLFFQLALVMGYAFAHAGRRMPPRAQALLHVLLLGAAVVTLSILPDASWKPPDTVAPASRVLTLLAVHVGFPFVLLAATAPMLQDWYGRLRPDRSPYPLYALSNAGSLGALVSYPLVVEPWLDVPAQAVLWQALFAAFAVVCAGCAWQVRRATGQAPARPASVASDSGAPPAARQLAWLLLPACGSALLVATTAQLTENVAPVPMLWMAPLVVYLATYIAAFAGVYSRGVAALAWVPALIAGALVMRGAGFGSLVVQALTYLAALAVACLLCHGEVARLKPTLRHLTDYYLAIAIGGAIGGGLVTVVAPMVFTSYTEFPLLYVAVTVVAAWVALDAFTGPSTRARRAAQAMLPAAAIVAAIVLLDRGPDPLRVVATTRNFYGIASVADDPPMARERLRRLYHGRILHGVQFLDPSRRREAAAYYARDTGIDLALRFHARRDRGEPLTIGVIGLGAGAMAAMTQPGDRIRFFELDPAIAGIAGTYFSYLRDAPATVEVALGDGRLALERELSDEGRREAYDVLALDAFSGDAVPVHLVTREAFETYRDAVGPDGIIAVNASNRFLDLRPVVRAQAAAIGMEMIHIARPASGAPGSTASTWLIVTASPAWLARYPRRTTDDTRIPWTDAWSSLIGVLR